MSKQQEFDDLILDMKATSEEQDFDKLMEELPSKSVTEKIIGLPGIKQAVGTGQELAEFLTGIPRMFGADIRAPKIVETGIPEKAAAGAIEYLLGGAALKGAPLVQRGIQAAGRIPAIGRAVASPLAQRMAGTAAMGAIGEPETPVRGAAIGAAITPAVELGFKVPGKALDIMTKSKFSPFHYMMMPHVRREFNEFIGKKGSSLGITPEHDVDKALYDRLNARYGSLEDQTKKLYDDASDLLEDIPYPTKNIESTFSKEKELYEGATDIMDKKSVRVLNSLEEKMKNPGRFRRDLHKEQTQAYKSGNFNLIDSLKNVEDKFNSELKSFAGTKEASPQLKEGLSELKEADKFFKENVVPFRERGSAKLQYGKRKPILTEFFKSHSADSSKGLSGRMSSKIQDLEHMAKIAPEIKDYLSFGSLKEGLNKPEEFIKNFSKLTKEQKDVLFGKEELSRLNKFKNIYDKNPRAFREFSLPTKVALPLGYGASLAPPLAGAGLAGLGALKGLSAIPAVREAYISGARQGLSPGSEFMKNILTGVLTGTLTDK